MGGTRGWVVGRAAGAPVVVSPGWLVAAAVLTFLVAPTVRAVSPSSGQAASYVVAAVFVLLLLGSVFLHELAHALVARRFGIVVHELAVTLLGGHTRFASAAPTPRVSTLVAVAGPAANLALAAVAWVLSAVLQGHGLVTLLITAAALANGFVGAFNLVPGLPLDGGRVLEAVVWHVTGSRARGTVVAGWVGRVVAVAVFAWTLVVPLLEGRSPSITGVVWGALVGSFLWSGAAGAVQGAQAERAVESLVLRDLMAEAVGVPASGTLGDLDGDAGSRPEVVLLAPDGRPAAYLDRSAAASVPADRLARIPLTAVAVAIPAGAVVDASLTGREAVQAVAAVARVAPVMAAVEGDRVVGLLSAQAVIDAVRRRSGPAQRSRT